MSNETETIDKAFEDIGWLFVHIGISLVAVALAAVGVFYL